MLHDSRCAHKQSHTLTSNNGPAHMFGRGIVIVIVVVVVIVIVIIIISG